MIGRVLVFILFILFITPVNLFGQNEENKVRFFKEISDNSIVEILSETQNGNSDKYVSEYGGWVKAIEVNADHEPLTGDTLKIWVQHNDDEVGGVSLYAINADLVFTCHPDEIFREEVRNKHMFPEKTGKVWVYSFMNDFIAVSSEENKSLEFASERHILKNFDYERSVKRDLIQKYFQMKP